MDKTPKDQRRQRDRPRTTWTKVLRVTREDNLVALVAVIKVVEKDIAAVKFAFA